MPGQHASTSSHGNAGLSLGGSGTLQPIQHGQPRASSIDRVPVPRHGLSAPERPRSASMQQHRHAGSGPHHGATRISSALGEVRLNVHRVTHGLARSSGPAPGTRSVASRDNSTVWGSGDPGSTGNSGQSAANSGAATTAGGSASSVASTVAAAVGSGTGGGNGNGNNGNNGNGNGNNGNHGNGNNGNHNGNGHH